MKSMTVKSTGRIAVLLIAMMIMTLFIGMTPFGTRADASAADETDSWVCYLVNDCRDANNNGHKATIYVENGQSFFISDWWVTAAGKYVDGGYYDQFGSEVTGATYSSSNKTVATVTSAGKVTLKEKGTATITIKYKTDTIKVTLKVVGKGTYTKKLKEIVSSNILEAIPSWKTNMNYAIKSACGGTTSSKSVKVNKDNYVAVTKYIAKSSDVVQYNYTRGGSAGLSYGMLYDGYYPTGRMAIPQAQTYRRVAEKWDTYAKKKVEGSSLTQESLKKDMMPKEFKGQAGDTVTVTAQMPASFSALRALVWTKTRGLYEVDPAFYSTDGYKKSYFLYNASGSKVTNNGYTVSADLGYKVGSKDVVLTINNKVAPGTYYFMERQYNYDTRSFEDVPISTITLS